MRGTRVAAHTVAPESNQVWFPLREQVIRTNRMEQEEKSQKQATALVYFPSAEAPECLQEIGGIKDVVTQQAGRTRSQHHLLCHTNRPEEGFRHNVLFVPEPDESSRGPLTAFLGKNPSFSMGISNFNTAPVLIKRDYPGIYAVISQVATFYNLDSDLYLALIQFVIESEKYALGKHTDKPDWDFVVSVTIFGSTKWHFGDEEGCDVGAGMAFAIGHFGEHTMPYDTPHAHEATTEARISLVLRYRTRPGIPQPTAAPKATAGPKATSTNCTESAPPPIKKGCSRCHYGPNGCARCVQDYVPRSDTKRLRPSTGCPRCHYGPNGCARCMQDYVPRSDTKCLRPSTGCSKCRYSVKGCSACK